MLFKFGSGAGSNSRRFAQQGDPQGGGEASGPVSFMADAFAGVIKSGGKTDAPRRW